MITIDELKANYNYTDEIIYPALDGLKKENLIEPHYVLPFTGLHRREVSRRVGLASLIMLPVVAAMVAPSAAQAASGCLATRGQSSDTFTGPFGPSNNSAACFANLRARCCLGNGSAGRLQL